MDAVPLAAFSAQELEYAGFPSVPDAGQEVVYFATKRFRLAGQLTAGLQHLAG
jgi:hypothetical protein